MLNEQPAPLIIAPSGVGEILDTGIRLARTNYRFLDSVAAWGVLPAYTIYGLAPLIPTATMGPGLLALIGVGFIAFVLLLSVSGLAVIRACAQLVDPTVAPHSVEAAYRGALRRLPALFLLSLLIGMAAIPLMIVFPLGIYIFIRWSQFPIIIGVEPVGAIGALRRSWQLTERSWWHTCGVELTASIVGGVLSGALGGMFGALASVVGFVVDNTLVSGLASGLGSALGSVVVLPFSDGVAVVLYYELRARAEGFDLAQRASLATQPR